MFHTYFSIIVTNLSELRAALRQANDSVCSLRVHTQGDGTKREKKNVYKAAPKGSNFFRISEDLGALLRITTFNQTCLLSAGFKQGTPAKDHHLLLAVSE